MNQTLFLLLLALPMIFQIIFGRKAIGESIKLTFFKICLITILSQFISFIIAFKILSNKLRAESNGQIHCGMPFVGLIGLEILITIIIVVIILVQYLIKRSYNRNYE
ncbi:hypothetical protein [Flavobacterium sp. KACC 22761]|uniref:hypothetical protein n=1 Tax=Flavobacterium sp. KACC 22761 TaxID=3092665 RepID=UPI002A750E79|nr:hypothetical protein [Flavobacterium sp. KACC 22761]WPO79375.1 hypothetical protein SCB73_03115 [Flavobacterium sp. KACC 22761]